MTGERPLLVVFSSRRSGECRRADGFLAQVLQRRGNHTTFRLLAVDVEDDPEQAARLRIDEVPTLLVIERRKICRRLAKPRSAIQIEEFLQPWLRRLAPARSPRSTTDA